MFSIDLKIYSSYKLFVLLIQSTFVFPIRSVIWMSLGDKFKEKHG